MDYNAFIYSCQLRRHQHHHHHHHHIRLINEIDVVHRSQLQLQYNRSINIVTADRRKNKTVVETNKYDVIKQTRNLSQCSRDARKPIAVPVRKLSVYFQPFRRSSFLECALQPKIAKINENLFLEV